MTETRTSTERDEFEQEQNLFELANLYPRNTGLPMTIWASVRGTAQHDARIKVCTTHGDRMDPGDLAVVAIRPQPRLLHGRLSPADLSAVQAWVDLNAPALLDYWNGAADTLDFVRRLRKV